MTGRSSWSAGSSRFAEGIRAADRAARKAGHSAAEPGSARAAQREMTGVSWDAAGLDLAQLREVGVEAARHRFRAALPGLIWNAAALEGNTFTLPEVRTLLDGVTVGGRRIEEERQILALSEAYSTVDEMVGAGTFRLDKGTSDLVHGLVARHEAIESGHFRGEGSVGGGGSVQLSTVGHVPGIPTEELPERWNRLVEYLEEIEDPRARALVFHAAATRAQFYFDGNKRTSRLLMTGALLAAGVDAVNVPHMRRLEYNIALDTLFGTGDATTLLRFLASCALPR
jgi:Fic family protein